jgi:5-methylcytosine-specific restriction endonuclease McrA
MYTKCMKHDLKNLPNEILLSNTRKLVREETNLTTSVLHHLREIESRNLFASLQYSSLFEYAVRDLGYPEACASRRIASMHLMQEVPELEGMLKRGDISLSVASQAQTFFNQEEKAGKKLTPNEKEKVVESLEGKTTRQADQVLAGISSEPKKPKRDKIRSIDGKLSEVRFTANEALLKDLEQLKGLLAHQHPNLSLGDLVSILAQRALKDLDPARKEVRPRKAPEKAVPAQEVTFKRIAVPAATKRALWKRDESRCAFICAKTGVRCLSRYQLQMDHLVPPQLGGTNELSNLRLACRQHNLWAAAQRYGEDHMRRYRRDVKSSGANRTPDKACAPSTI